MKIELHILNNESQQERDLKTSGIPDIIKDEMEASAPTWHMRRSSYECEDQHIADDMINCPIGHKLDRMLIGDVQITSIDQIDKIIKLLENAKPCFK